jgi:calcineurin-like phosphoesterase family protein
MIRHWNEVVAPRDIVLHLGDFAAGVGSYPNGYKMIKMIASKLNGDKILIRGNHDHKSSKYFKEELWFEDTMDYLIIDNILLSHYSLITYKNDSTRIKNIKKNRLAIFKKENCRFVIHGHAHRQDSNHPKHFNVASDLHNFYPISLESIKLSF